ncbi:anti-sigma B factor antagonist [Lachnospiraceae bacterium KH1T2]|nr:anti-sigma B factor antagonist [Lachnospiraceae bacterium KH1T2]
MNIEKNQNGSELVVKVIGRVDTVTAPELESQVKESLEGITNLELNLEELEYISSAGLRVILSLQKIMSKQGRLIITNVNETVQDIFEVTGFSEILTIE